MIEKITTPKAPAPIGPYSQATRIGNFIFVSGQIAIDPNSGKVETFSGDVGAQTRLVLSNLKAVLNAAGCDFYDVAKTTIFLSSMKHFEVVNEEYEKAFSESKPARATVAVQGLPAGVDVEIEAIAFKS